MLSLKGVDDWSILAKNKKGKTLTQTVNHPVFYTFVAICIAYLLYVIFLWFQTNNCGE